MEKVEELFPKVEEALQKLRSKLERGELPLQEAAYTLKKALMLLELSAQKEANPLEISSVLDLAEREREITTKLLVELGELLTQAEGPDIRKKLQEELRKITLWLQPPDDFIRMGMAEGLRFFARKALEGLPVQIELNIESLPDRLPDLLALFLFRIFQGALLYACQSAQARKIKLSLQKEKDLLLLNLQHDGLAFDEQKAEMLSTIIPLYTRVRALGGNLKIQECFLHITVPFAL
jgi:signal transduction histidine kinase